MLLKIRKSTFILKLNTYVHKYVREVLCISKYRFLICGNIKYYKYTYIHYTYICKYIHTHAWDFD